MLVQLLLAQYGIDRLGQCRPLARPQRTMVAKEAPDHGVGRMVELQDQRQQMGTGLEQRQDAWSGSSHAPNATTRLCQRTLH